MIMIGERMKGLWKKPDLTLEALAKKCMVSTNTVWRWEQDKQMPDGIRIQGKIVGAWAGILKQGI